MMTSSWLFGSVWMTIIWIIISGLIVAGIVLLLRRGSSGTDSGEKLSPLDIAKERYAKGEISREEFERIKHELS